MHQLPDYFIPLSILLSPALLIGAAVFAARFYKEQSAPVGCAAYAVILVVAAAGGYLFGLYYGGDWTFHSGVVACGESGVACALFAVLFAGPAGAAFAMVCVAVFLGRR